MENIREDAIKALLQGNKRKEQHSCLLKDILALDNVTIDKNIELKIGRKVVKVKEAIFMPNYLDNSAEITMVKEYFLRNKKGCYAICLSDSTILVMVKKNQFWMQFGGGVATRVNSS